MRVISLEDKTAWVKQYLTNPDLSYQAIANQVGCSATGLRNWVFEFQNNNGVIGEAQIGGFRWSLGFEAIHCEICQLIFQLGHQVSNPKLATAVNERYSIDASTEAMRSYRIKHNLPRNCKDKGKQGGDWAKVTEVIDENGEIRPTARADFEAKLLTTASDDRDGKHYSAVFRKKVVYKVINGELSVKEACEKFDLYDKTLYYWISLYKKEGRLTRKKRAKNRLTFDLADYPILAMARSYPELSCYALKIWLMENNQLNCSVKRIQEHLTSHHVKRPLGTKPLAEKQLASIAKELYSVEELAKVEQPIDVELSSQDHPLMQLNDDLPLRVKALLVKEVIKYWKLFHQCFGKLTDHRTGHKKAGALVSMLFIVLLSILVSAGTAANVVRFGTNQRLKWIRPMMREDALESTPGEVTIQRMMRGIDCEELRQCAIQFTRRRREQLDLPMTGITIAWDAKTCRGSLDGPDSDYLHTATYMDHQTRETLAIFPTGRLAKERQSLLDTIASGQIPIKGNMITADALHGKPIVTQTICRYGGDYLLAVKEPNIIAQQSRDLPDILPETAFDEVQEQDHKRPSTKRRCQVWNVQDWFGNRHKQWANLQTIIFYTVEDPTRENKKKRSKKTNHDQTDFASTRIFLSSRRLTASEAIKIIRSHWGIEENHYLLDVDMKEDHHQARKDNAPFVWAIMKRLGLNELFRSRGKEPISGAMNYSQGCIWHLFAQLTQFHLKYPKYAKYFDFKS